MCEVECRDVRSRRHAARARHAKPSRRGSIHASYFKLPATGREILNPPLTDAGSYDPVDKNAGCMDVIGVKLAGRYDFFDFGDRCIRSRGHVRLEIASCLAKHEIPLREIGKASCRERVCQYV